MLRTYDNYIMNIIILAILQLSYYIMVYTIYRIYNIIIFMYHIEREYENEQYEYPNVYIYFHDSDVNNLKKIYHKKVYSMNRIKSARKILITE